MTTRTKSATKAVTPPVELPDWITKTPDECIYAVTMWETGGDWVEEVKLTREEYLALKLRLAELRGFPVDEAKAALQEA